MKVNITWYLLVNVITFIGLVAIFQLPLVNDWIANSTTFVPPLTKSEVFVGVFGILEVIYTCLLAATIRL